MRGRAGLLVTDNSNQQGLIMIRSRIALTAASTLAAVPAFAHPGHIETLDGHSHWLAWGAGAAAILLLAGALFFGYRTILRRNR